MQFQRLRLVGFKSFVDPAEVHIEPGLTGVVGPNGCGKTTLLRCVTGLTRPDAGRIAWQFAARHACEAAGALRS